MKKALLASLLIGMAALSVTAQTTPGMPTAELQEQMKELDALKPRFGVKAGYNIAKVTGSSVNFTPDTKNGFMVAAFYSPGAKTGVGYRTELVSPARALALMKVVSKQP